MKTIIQIDDYQPQDKRFFEHQLQQAIAGLESQATHASLKLSRQAADSSQTEQTSEDGSAYSCRIALAFRNWGIIVAESMAKSAALAMERALQQLRSAAQQLVRPESRSEMLSRKARLVCC